MSRVEAFRPSQVEGNFGTQTLPLESDFNGGIENTIPELPYLNDIPPYWERNENMGLLNAA